MGRWDSAKQNDGSPLALTAEVRGKPRVVAVCSAGARRGISIGMALAEAKAFAADLLAVPWNEETIARAALEVTTALLAASPRVAWERGLGVWWVDAAGLGDEPKLARQLSIIANDFRCGPVRCGIADSAIAAYAATTARSGARPSHCPTVPLSHRPPVRLSDCPSVIVPPRGDAAYLAPFPLELLDLDDELAAALRALGLARVGELAALSSDEVEARFGPAGLAAHQLARGHDTRGPVTPRDDSIPVIRCDLGGPVDTTEPLLFVLNGALAALGGQLRTRGLAARELLLTVELDDGNSADLAIRPARPTSHPGALFDHTRASLENWQVEAPAVALTLTASLTVPASGEQGDLLVPRWADPAALDGAFERIRGREGPDSVAIPEPRDGHLPHDAGGWRNGGIERIAATSGRKAGRVSEPALRGYPAVVPALRLLAEPHPVRVRMGRAGLQAFRHDDAWHDVTAWAGPERLAPRWWLSGGGARDYYTTRARDGTLWLLYRGVRERTWFLEGWWD